MTSDFTESDEPLRLFAAWFSDAGKAEGLAEAMTLATVDADGLPDARMVLLKGFDERGFVFYSSADSAKGRELAATPKGALVFHWKSLNRQVRLRGPVAPVADAEADAYFREPAAPCADRRLGEPAVGPARKPPGVRKGDCGRHGAIRDRHGAPAALLDWLPARSGQHRVLAGPALSAARPHRIPARRAGAPWSKTRLYP